MKKDNETKKLPGFYIALCCCVIAIGVAGFVMGGDDSTPTDAPTVAETEAEPYVALSDEDEAEFAEVAEVNLPEATEEAIIDSVPAEVASEDYTLDNPDVVSAAVIVNAEEEHMFTPPVAEMTIKFGLATDTLMYNEYYKDWRTHNGVDIAAPVGCSVMASADGTVKSVGKSSYGKTVTIEHADGFCSVYAQLGDASCKEGDAVKQGDVIGTVGKSIGENLTEPHLHYEILKDGKPQNPEEY